MQAQDTQFEPTSRYGQLHVVCVSLQTLDDYIEEAWFVEDRERLAADLTGGTTQQETDGYWR